MQSAYERMVFSRALAARVGIALAALGFLSSIAMFFVTLPGIPLGGFLLCNAVWIASNYNLLGTTMRLQAAVDMKKLHSDMVALPGTYHLVAGDTFEVPAAGKTTRIRAHNAVTFEVL